MFLFCLKSFASPECFLYEICLLVIVCVKFTSSVGYTSVQFSLDEKGSNLRLLESPLVLSVDWPEIKQNSNTCEIYSYIAQSLVQQLFVLFLGLLCDLLWSDPDKDVQGWGENDRGVSFTFGPDIVSKFLAKHDLDLICRAHQVNNLTVNNYNSCCAIFISDYYYYWSR